MFHRYRIWAIESFPSFSLLESWSKISPRAMRFQKKKENVQPRSNDARNDQTKEKKNEKIMRAIDRRSEGNVCSHLFFFFLLLLIRASFFSCVRSWRTVDGVHQPSGWPSNTRKGKGKLTKEKKRRKINKISFLI